MTTSILGSDVAAHHVWITVVERAGVTVGVGDDLTTVGGGGGELSERVVRGGEVSCCCAVAALVDGFGCVVGV